MKQDHQFLEAINNLCNDGKEFKEFSSVYNLIFNNSEEMIIKASEDTCLELVKKLCLELERRRDFVSLLAVIDVVHKFQKAQGDEGFIRICARLGGFFYEDNKLNDAIASFEYLSFFQSRLKTVLIRLGSLYFKRALCASASPTIQELSAAAIDLGRAYQNNPFFFELCRINWSNAELYPSKGTLVKLKDIETIANRAYIIIELIIQSDISLLNPHAYKLWREAALLLEKKVELEMFQRLWLRCYYTKSEMLYNQKSYDECIYLCRLVIELHPKYADKSAFLHRFYRLLRLCCEQMNRPIEAELYGQLSIAFHYIPPVQVGPLVRMAQLHSCDSEIVLAYLSEKYIELFDIWHKFFLRNSNGNLLVVAMDHNASLYLSENGINNILKPFFFYQKDFLNESGFSADRVQALIDLLCSGLNVVVTGIDSLWIKNPMDQLRSLPNDIISMGLESRIKNWPLNVNFDFVYAKASAPLIKHIPLLMNYSDRFLWDQNAVNFWLSDLDVNFSQLESGAWTGKAKDSDFSAHLLSPSFAARDPKLLSENTYVIQPPGGLGGKIKFAKKILADLL